MREFKSARRKRRLLLSCSWRRTRGDGLGKMVERSLVRRYVSVEGTCIGNTCMFVCAVRYISAIRTYSRAYIRGCACGCPYTRQAGTYISGGCTRVHRPIGSKHSLSTRVSWTHASRTRRGLGPPLFEYMPVFSGHWIFCARGGAAYIRLPPCQRLASVSAATLRFLCFSLIFWRNRRVSPRTKRWSKDKTFCEKCKCIIFNRYMYIIEERLTVRFIRWRVRNYGER